MSSQSSLRTPLRKVSPASRHRERFASQKPVTSCVDIEDDRAGGHKSGPLSHTGSSCGATGENAKMTPSSAPRAATFLRSKASDARLSLPHLHPRPQHGRRARALARDRHEGRRFRQADHRHRQFLHPVRARPRAPEGPRPARRARDRGGGRRRQGVQHHRRRRRHRDGPRRHALFAALARDHRRQRRVHGQRPLRRRAGLHLQLRQDHAGHADGGDAPQHPRGVRLRRADGGRQGQALERHDARRST